MVSLTISEFPMLKFKVIIIVDIDEDLVYTSIRRDEYHFLNILSKAIKPNIRKLSFYKN